MRPSVTIRSRLFIAIATLAAGMAFPTGAAPVSAVPPAPALRPGGGAVLRGAAAVRYLESTGRAPEFAAAADVSTPEMVSALEDDPTLFIDPAFVLTGAIEPPAPADVTVGAAAPLTPVPDGVDVSRLHSRPGAQRTIFIDLDGHVSDGDAWTRNYTGNALFTSPAFDFDGDPTGWSADEQATIYEVWQRVVDDFAQFDIDVTTEDPGPARIVRTNSTDQVYGQRVVITTTNPVASRCSCGGISYIGIFDTAYDWPAFVFLTNVGHSPKNVAEGVTHEIGHSLGLQHDGTAVTSYYAGHGDWAPIMGVGYYRTITQWSRGEYTGANNIQDDLAVMQSHGASLRADDHGATAGTATVVAAGDTVAGLISSRDTDAFSVDTGGGPFTATVAPRGLDLHARVDVIDAAGTVVATASPGTALGFTVAATADVAAGAYTVRVTGIGWLDPATSGFSAYGSIGAYDLTIDAAPAPTTTTTTTTLAPTTTSAPTTAPPTTTPPTTTPPAAPVDRRSGFTPTSPVRLTGAGRHLATGGELRLTAVGTAGVPAGATAAAVTVTASGVTATGRLAVIPCGTRTPATTTTTLAPGATTTVSTFANLDSSGRFCIWSSSETDLDVDLNGWFAPGTGTRLTAVSPRRVVDTRRALGGGRLAASRTLALDLSDQAPGASAVAVTITATGPAANGSIVASPCGRTRPRGATLTFAAGDVRANTAIVALGGGSLCVFTTAATDVVVDLVGVFGERGLRYLPAAPRRLLDGGAPAAPRGARTTAEFDVPRAPTGAAAAAAVVMTASGSPADGYAVAFGCGPRPATSTISQITGRAASNATIVKTSASGTACVYTLAGGRITVDLTGWWV